MNKRHTETTERQEEFNKQQGEVNKQQGEVNKQNAEQFKQNAEQFKQHAEQFKQQGEINENLTKQLNQQGAIVNQHSQDLKGHAEEIYYLKLENEERKSENKKMKTQLDDLEQRGLIPPRANGGECNNLTAVLCSCLNATFFLRYIICISTEQRSSH